MLIANREAKQAPLIAVKAAARTTFHRPKNNPEDHRRLAQPSKWQFFLLMFYIILIT